MTSIEAFYYQYYANRLLREGYISQQEYQTLLNASHQATAAMTNISMEHPAGSADAVQPTGYNRCHGNAAHRTAAAHGMEYPN